MSKVLVVDDEVEVAEFLCRFLERIKITAESVNDGFKALEMFGAIEPEWVFLDIKMPGMDGFEVLKELKKRGIKSKVIVITGKDDEESKNKAQQLGAIDFFIKPLDLEELHAKVKTHILKQPPN